MSISYKKHMNADENGSVEFLMIHFDFVDGNGLLAKFFKENYDMIPDTKLDGIDYNMIKLHLKDTEYNLVWHEDVGNY